MEERFILRQKSLRIVPSAKVIMCSALGTEQNIREALKIRASNFIVKPYFHKLIPIVSNLV